MEEGTKQRRWRVTYTKHVKQKRKVYHDGFLELSASGDKVRLYDESENLIESKFLGKADSVECGKSLTMDSHLVDIADAVHLSSNPTVTPLAQQNGSKINSFHRKPLHKVSNMMESNTKVMEQVELYDEHKRLLESKVLGKDDMLESGRTLIMQGHLVDIGLSTLEVGKENCSGSSLRKPFQKPAYTIHSFVDKWNVLYTTQLNKKAKTYHDGILRLSQATGSLTKQITLASEDGQILGSRHMKSFECIESGAEYELTGYMIQVYDLRVSQEGCEGSKQRSPLKQFVKSKTLMKSIPANGVDYGTKKEQVKSMSTQTGNNKEMKRPTNTMECISVARRDGYAGSNQRSALKQFVKSKTLMKNIPTNGVDYGTKKEQVKSTSTQTGNSKEVKKSTNTKECITVVRRDARQIMSVLKKPTAVPEREAAEVAKKVHLSSHLIQIDVSTGLHDKLPLPSAQGLHDKDGNAYHCSLTSPPSIESGTQALEMQMMVKENCSSSSMHNSSSVLSDITMSASPEGRCEGVILGLEKANWTADTVEVLFADADNFDFPTFDLGF